MSALLQTTTAVITDTEEKKSKNIRILFDSGSQKSYISERTANELNLKPVSSQNLIIKTFGNTSNKSVETREYTICLKGINGGSFYLNAFSVPFICSTLRKQNVELAKKQYPIINKFKFSDVKCNDEIDILIGADFYWSFVSNDMIRCGDTGLVATDTKLGCVLSGPIESPASNEASVNFTHAMKISISFNEDNRLNDQVERFWDLDAIGIKNDEKSVS